jgi:hypothetical protein
MTDETASILDLEKHYARQNEVLRTLSFSNRELDQELFGSYRFTGFTTHHHGLTSAGFKRATNRGYEGIATLYASDCRKVIHTGELSDATDKEKASATEALKGLLEIRRTERSLSEPEEP